VRGEVRCLAALDWRRGARSRSSSVGGHDFAEVARIAENPEPCRQDLRATGSTPPLRELRGLVPSWRAGGCVGDGVAGMHRTLRLRRVAFESSQQCSELLANANSNAAGTASRPDGGHRHDRTIDGPGKPRTSCVMRRGHASSNTKTSRSRPPAAGPRTRQSSHRRRAVKRNARPSMSGTMNVLDSNGGSAAIKGSLYG